MTYAPHPDDIQSFRERHRVNRGFAKRALRHGYTSLVVLPKPYNTSENLRNDGYKIGRDFMYGTRGKFLFRDPEVAIMVKLKYA